MGFNLCLLQLYTSRPYCIEDGGISHVTDPRRAYGAFTSTFRFTFCGVTWKFGGGFKGVGEFGSDFFLQKAAFPRIKGI